MRVRFSTGARRYLVRETAYLKERSPAGAARFERIVARALRQIEAFPDSGVTDALVALAGARRVTIEEYLFDYDFTDGVATIMVVRHARNTLVTPLDADADHEEPPPGKS